MGCREARNVPRQPMNLNFLLANACQVAQRPAFGLPPRAGIELVPPPSGTVDLVPKPLLGVEGAATLVERIVNACSSLL